MLAPDDRRLLLDALLPPDGYRLSDGIVTTYSLDLDALLLVPSRLTGGGSNREDGQPPEDRIGLLGALRRAVTRLSVFFQDGRISEPSHQHPIYALLEGIVVAARARNGGEFHSKVWLLRFGSEQRDEPTRMRLLVLSRNLTFDRCWDVSLSLDGTVRGRAQAINRPISEFITELGRTRGIGDRHRQRTERLAEEVRLVEWELPEGYDDVRFHPLGITADARGWLPGNSHRLVVISPFLADSALDGLAGTTDDAVALISRPEELDKLEKVPPFAQVFTLNDRAEAEDGEDTGASRLLGLHAKVYVAKEGARTHIFVGSANASVAALGAGKTGPRNVEFMAELVGRGAHPKVRGIDELLEEDGLMPLLMPWSKTAIVAVDPDQVAAERALEGARRSLVDSGLSLEFRPSGTLWKATIRAARRPSFDGLLVARGRLITLHPETAVDLRPLSNGESFELPESDITSCTGFFGVELTASRAPQEVRFVLALPTEGLPADRDAHIVRSMIGNEGRFLAYIEALLGVPPLDGRGAGGHTHHTSDRSSAGDSTLGAGLLERLLRAKARDPFAMDEIKQVVEQLVSTPEGQRLVPPNFLRVWETLGGQEAV
jgi:hypothetical protein